MFYGADYYPEQETRDEIIADAKRMREQGFNVTRIGEFAWTQLEPRDGEFNMEWLLDVINILGQEGIRVIVCTPSACPPIWLVEKSPEILYVDNCGFTRPFGGRRHYCYNNETYRMYCVRIAGEIAKAVAGNPCVLGIHIDNEMAQEATGRCQCPVCRDKFHGWLAEKYNTIDEFNRRAGTMFWNQTYERFEQISLPVSSIEVYGSSPLPIFIDNPTLRLDFERFASDSMVEFVKCQADVMREFVSLPFTTNSTGTGVCGVDYYKAFSELDVVALDVYPSLRSNRLYDSSFAYDFTRGIKDGKPFWIVETSSGGGQAAWTHQGVNQPYPGTLMQNALHALASDAETFIYFQYKTFRYGAEQLDPAVLDIDGVERRRNVEMRQTSVMLQKAGNALENTVIRNDIAICFDYHSHWAIKIKPFNGDFVYQDRLERLHTALRKVMLQSDIIPIDETIFKYKTVILPYAVILSDKSRALLEQYVNGGGTLVATYLTGIKNDDNTADRSGIPAGLTELFGLRVGEGDPVYDNIAKIRVNSGAVCDNGIWCESLELDTAQPLAVFDDTFRKGEVCAAVNNYGRGQAYYIGTELDEDALKALLLKICTQSGVSPAPFKCPDGVEVITRLREAGGKAVYCVFNALETSAEIEMLNDFECALSGEKFGKNYQLEAKQTLFLTSSNDI